MTKSVSYYEKQLTKVVDNFEVFLSGHTLYKKSHDSLVHVQEQANRISKLVTDTGYIQKQPAPITGPISAPQMQQIIANMNITGLKSLQAILNQVIADKDRKGATSIPKITESIDDGEIKDTFFGSLYNGLQIVDESDLLRW